MINSDEFHGEIIDFYYLKNSITELSGCVAVLCAAVVGLETYNYISFWGIPRSVEAFFSRIEYSGSLQVKAFACIIALILCIGSVIGIIARRKCYIAFTESTVYGIAPAFPFRTKGFEISYKDITVIKRGMKSRYSTDFALLIIKTESQTVHIPQNNNTKIRKIENLLYEMKER